MANLINVFSLLKSPKRFSLFILFSKAFHWKENAYLNLPTDWLILVLHKMVCNKIQPDHSLSTTVKFCAGMYLSRKHILVIFCTFKSTNFSQNRQWHNFKILLSRKKDLSKVNKSSTIAEINFQFWNVFVFKFVLKMVARGGQSENVFKLWNDFCVQSKGITIQVDDISNRDFF